MTIFLNTKQYGQVETVDEFTREEEQTPKEFRKYVSEMISSYRMNGISVYKSSRPTNDWKNR